MRNARFKSKLFVFIVYSLVTCWPLVPAMAIAALNVRVKAKPETCNKPFKNALVLAGGGLTPGVTLGMLAAIQASGQKPDVVIATCGSSIGSAIVNAFPDPKDAKAFVKSRAFHRYLKTNLKFGKTSPLGLKAKLDASGSIHGTAPNIFDKNLLEVPESFTNLFPDQNFPKVQGQPRFITVAARAKFGKESVGHGLISGHLFKQVYFTDDETAKTLENMPASMKRNFPNSPIDPQTEVVTKIDMVQAARASISDPFMINPAKIGNNYYFAGAMDLFPIETAQAIACETTATGSSGEYSDIEDQAVKSGFGFSQTERVRQLSKYKNVRWIDTKGVADLAMDPSGDVFGFVDNIPDSYEEFAEKIERQWELGYDRAARVHPGAAQGAKRSTSPAAMTSRAAAR